MRATTTRTGFRSRRLSAVVGAALGSVLLAALVGAPAYADATSVSSGNDRTAAVAPRSGGPLWVQTDPVAFDRSLTGADRAYVQVSEVPALTIPFPGVWEVSYSARVYLNPGATTTWEYVNTALSKNGAVIPGSEALTGIYGSNVASFHTAGQTFMATFAAGDVVTLQAFRVGQTGSAAIQSNADGRTGVMAHWVTAGS